MLSHLIISINFFSSTPGSGIHKKPYPHFTERQTEMQEIKRHVQNKATGREASTGDWLSLSSHLLHSQAGNRTRPGLHGVLAAPCHHPGGLSQATAPRGNLGHVSGLPMGDKYPLLYQELE